ncbi:MAG: Fe-S cluster assembly protein SufD, partial [Candidatus Dependentiae bacterium]|nr:Fe-S cluster assembly protein SufD [Candidatus Dependentiae bacterium]
MSTVRIFGVSSQNSRASVASTIFIAPHLGGVAARQVHKHLLLDVGSRATSVPALDILSNDVSCSHGSAITHLDAAQLFYLQARGYDLEAARDTVVKAFLRC